MPPKRSGGPDSASPSRKRAKVSTTESTGGTQRKLEAFFTTPKKAKPQSASPFRDRRTVLERARPQEVIDVDDEEGEHPVSIGLLPEERMPAAGNGNDCAAGPVIIPTTPMMEEDPAGVRDKDVSNRTDESGMNTDMLLARRLARAEGIDIELARKLESGFKPGTDRLLDGPGSLSNASRNVSAPLFTPLNCLI